MNINIYLMIEKNDYTKVVEVIKKFKKCELIKKEENELKNANSIVELTYAFKSEYESLLEFYEDNKVCLIKDVINKFSPYGIAIYDDNDKYLMLPFLVAKENF